MLGLSFLRRVPPARIIFYFLRRIPPACTIFSAVSRPHTLFFFAVPRPRILFSLFFSRPLRVFRAFPLWAQYYLLSGSFLASVGLAARRSWLTSHTYFFLTAVCCGPSWPRSCRPVLAQVYCRHHPQTACPIIRSGSLPNQPNYRSGLSTAAVLPLHLQHFFSVCITSMTFASPASRSSGRVANHRSTLSSPSYLPLFDYYNTMIYYLLFLYIHGYLSRLQPYTLSTINLLVRACVSKNTFYTQRIIY